MPWLFFNLATISITALYYIDRKACEMLGIQDRRLRRRVAFMLWSAAQHSRL